MTVSAWDLSYQVTSIFSVIGSGLVVLTLLLFKSMQNKLFMQIIANISLADLLGNIQYTMRYRPSNGAFWCSMQGFLNLYAYPCSWLWTTMLVRYLYDLAVYREIRLNFKVSFVFCWGMPLIPTLLVFAFVPTGTYTRRSGEPNTSLCSYGGGGQDSFTWHVVSYYGLFMTCVLYMAYLYVLIRQAYRKETENLAAMSAQSQHGGGRERDSGVSTTSSATLNGMKLTSDSLLLNPLIMIVLWAPHVLMVLVSITNHNISNQGSGAGLNLKILHGLCTSVLFFCRSQAARKLWLKLLLGKYKFNKTTAEAIDEEAMFRESENRVSDFRITDNFHPSISSLAVGNPLSGAIRDSEL